MSRINDMNIELNRLFNEFNKTLFDSKLPQVVLSIHTNGNNRRTMGWFTPHKVWKDELQQSYYHEIAISAEYLYRSYEEICSTLIHEMVHLYCHTNGIKDTSRNGSYHNKRFKAEAELGGLIIGYDKRIGHSPTTLADETKKYIETLRNEEKFELTRINCICQLNNSPRNCPHPIILDQIYNRRYACIHYKRRKKLSIY